jgi:hypothetical protein
VGPTRREQQPPSPRLARRLVCCWIVIFLFFFLLFLFLFLFIF